MKSAQKSEPQATTKKARESGRTIFNQIVLVFTIGCVFGTYWEEIMCIVRTLWETGTFQWVSRRGLLYGPFSPVYGIGAVLLYLIFYLPKLKSWICFFGGALFGGVLEALLNIVQEALFHTVSWDYSDRWLNILGGRTTIPYMVVWGALVVLFAQIVFPWLEKLYAKVPVKTINVVCCSSGSFDIGRGDFGGGNAAAGAAAGGRSGGFCD